MDKATGKAPAITVDSGSSSDSSSNVSAIPDHGDTACKLLVLAHEAAKNKTKMEEEAGEIPGATDAPFLLDLTLVNASLSLDDPLRSNKVMVIKESSSSVNSARGELPPANRVFICTYCKKEFSSWQALGGHQNAHRLERLMVKRQQEMNRQGPPSTMTYGYGGFNAPYSNVPQFPAFGPLNQLALPGAGMAQPMVQMVQPSWSQPGSQVVQNGPRPGHPPMMASPPPRMDTNFNNNFNNGGLVGQCRFNPPPAFDHLQQGGSAMMHSFRGPSSIPTPNVPMNTVANGGGSNRGGGRSSGNRHVLPGKRDDLPKTDHGEPDLTLKL